MGGGRFTAELLIMSKPDTEMESSNNVPHNIIHNSFQGLFQGLP